MINYSKNALRSLETCLSVNNLCEKLVSLLESSIIFNDRFKDFSVLSLILDFSLLSCKLDYSTFPLLY